MLPEEALVDYFNHYLLSTIVSALVTIFCLWLGILWEKNREKTKAEEEFKRKKESFVVSLWEIGVRCQKFQEDDWKTKEISGQNGNFSYQKNLLNLFQADFYEVAKENNFFDFDYPTKVEALVLKENIFLVNEVIRLLNSIHGKFENLEPLEGIKSYEAQIAVAVKAIDGSYKRLVTSKFLAGLVLKHFGKLEEFKDKIKAYEKNRR